jgi:hypothetical protein
MRDFMTTREITDLLDVREWEIENALRRGDVPRPPVVGGVRLWSSLHVERLRQVFRNRRATSGATPGAGA